MQTKGELLIRWENGQEEHVGTVDMDALGPKVLVSMENDRELRDSLVSTQTVKAAVDWVQKAVKAK